MHSLFIYAFKSFLSQTTISKRSSAFSDLLDDSNYVIWFSPRCPPKCANHLYPYWFCTGLMKRFWCRLLLIGSKEMIGITSFDYTDFRNFTLGDPSEVGAPLWEILDPPLRSILKKLCFEGESIRYYWKEIFWIEIVVRFETAIHWRLMLNGNNYSLVTELLL